MVAFLLVRGRLALHSFLGPTSRDVEARESVFKFAWSSSNLKKLTYGIHTGFICCLERMYSDLELCLGLLCSTLILCLRTWDACLVTSFLWEFWVWLSVCLRSTTMSLFYWHKWQENNIGANLSIRNFLLKKKHVFFLHNIKDFFSFKKKKKF